MPDNPIAGNELDALTRRTEAVEDRVEALQVQTGGNFAAVIEGQAALRREVRDGFSSTNQRLNETNERLGALADEVRSGNARSIELLTALVGRDSDTPHGNGA